LTHLLQVSKSDTADTAIGSATCRWLWYNILVTSNNILSSVKL